MQVEWKRLPEGDPPLTQLQALITNAGSTMMLNQICTRTPRPSLCEAVVGLEYTDVKVSRSQPQLHVQYKHSDSDRASVTSACPRQTSRHCYSTVSLLNVIVVKYILLEDGVLRRIMSVNATQLPLTDLFWLFRIWCFVYFFPFWTIAKPVVRIFLL